MPCNMAPGSCQEECNNSDPSVLSVTFEVADLLYHRDCLKTQSSPSLLPVQAFVSMVIEQAFKWDCKLCFDPPRALETTCHITFISLLNCKMILSSEASFQMARKGESVSSPTQLLI